MDIGHTQAVAGANREFQFIDASAEQFRDATGITGIVLTKLDGTAKGGVVLAINEGLGIPVKLIGVGEQIDDLQPFNAEEFARALFETVE